MWLTPGYVNRGILIYLVIIKYVFGLILVFVYKNEDMHNLNCNLSRKPSWIKLTHLWFTPGYLNRDILISPIIFKCVFGLILVFVYKNEYMHKSNWNLYRKPSWIKLTHLWFTSGYLNRDILISPKIFKYEPIFTDISTRP